MKNTYELLAPAGSFTTLVTAINAGADAVYFGLKEFSLRANAENFYLRDLDKINKICKPRNIKKYLAINTIIYDEELDKLEKIFKKLKGKIDAVICWDLGVVELCRKYKIPFHISTQGSVANSGSAKFYKKLGAQRIILARELNLKQIKKISKIIDVECFAHGAMCLAVSGRCFMSQFLFNKSANRGKCIHPCRRSYIIKDKQEGYELKLENDKILSVKDLCTLPFIEKLKKAGIKSFKIEGRNRDPRYVDAVVRIYRKALDKKLTKDSRTKSQVSSSKRERQEIEKSIEKLKEVYNKGFSSGFYLGLPTPDNFSKVEHSSATKHKHFVGQIKHYYPKINVGIIKLVSELKIGDELVIIGKTTGLKKARVESMEIKHKKIEKGKKGYEIGVKLPEARKGDEVYVVKNNIESKRIVCKSL